jgi:hypothetical protein
MLGVCPPSWSGGRWPARTEVDETIDEVRAIAHGIYRSLTSPALGRSPTSAGEGTRGTGSVPLR